MVVLTFSIDPALSVEERLRLKDALAAVYRAATNTDDEIGVDRAESGGAT